MPEKMATIPFDEIAAGSSARVCVIENMQHLSVRDILMHVCSLSTVRANEKWRLLPDEVKNEVAEFLGNFQFPGKGNKSEPVITFKGALKLVMMISGEKAALYRSSMAKILTRYYAGDGSLLEEVEANAQSSAPVAQMARGALVAEATPVLCLPNKRKLEELEMAKLEAEIESRRAETEVRRAETEARRRLANHEHITKCTASYQDMCKDTIMDERARLIFKDLYLNMAMLQEQPPVATSGRALLTNSPSLINKPISLSLVAGGMGLKLPSNELISIGGELKKRYVEKHGTSPPKHDQLCEGRVTKVNSYLESDRPLVEEVLRWHAAGRPQPA
jgi:hypothetical protein